MKEKKKDMDYETVIIHSKKRKSENNLCNYFVRFLEIGKEFCNFVSMENYHKTGRFTQDISKP